MTIDDHHDIGFELCRVRRYVENLSWRIRGIAGVSVHVADDNGDEVIGAALEAEKQLKQLCKLLDERCRREHGNQSVCFYLDREAEDSDMHARVWDEVDCDG